MTSSEKRAYIQGKIACLSRDTLFGCPYSDSYRQYWILGFQSQFSDITDMIKLLTKELNNVK